MNLDQHEANPDKNVNSELPGVNRESQVVSNFNNENNEIKDSKVNLTENNTDSKNNKIVEDNKKIQLNPKVNENINKTNNIEKRNEEVIKEKTSGNKKLTIAEPISNLSINKSTENIDNPKNNLPKENNLENNKKESLTAKSISNTDKIKNNPKQISTSTPVKAKTKPVKQPPIEKKPFIEFVNDYLIPEIKNEFKLKGKEVNIINLQKTNRPIAEDICWVIYCEINNTCNFWLSFEKDDITSLKSFSLCKNYEKPSIIESFLIDEKKITLKLIISRILQRLNGQKLIGAN